MCCLRSIAFTGRHICVRTIQLSRTKPIRVPSIRASTRSLELGARNLRRGRWRWRSGLGVCAQTSVVPQQGMREARSFRAVWKANTLPRASPERREKRTCLMIALPAAVQQDGMPAPHLYKIRALRWARWTCFAAEVLTCAMERVQGGMNRLRVEDLIRV